MDSAASEFVDGELPVALDGSQSLLLVLHRSALPPSHKDAVKLDLIRRGISSAEHIPPTSEQLPAAVKAASPSPIKPETPREKHEIPVKLATVGRPPVMSRPATRTSTPSLVRAQRPPDSTVPPVRSTRFQPAPGNATNPSDMLDGGQIAAIEPMYSLEADGNPGKQYVGSCLIVNLYYPENLEEHTRGDKNWTPKWKVAKGKTVPTPYRLHLDPGSIHPWVFCAIRFDTLECCKGVAGTLGPEHEVLFDKKSKLPMPPEAHLDEDNVATLAYGTAKDKASLRIAQTLVKIQYESMDDGEIELPPCAMGVAIGVSPDDLLCTEDGVLALGRTYHAVSSFGEKARWESKTLVRHLFETGRIRKQAFTIYVDHPLLVENSQDCIIFGPVYNPHHPEISENKSDWTIVPVVLTQPSSSGHWVVRLKSILVKRPYHPEDNFNPVMVEAPCIVDNGCTQSHLPSDAFQTLEEILKKCGASTGFVPLKTFDRCDKVEFTFESSTGEYRTITGQARRFFTSPYKDNGEELPAIAPADRGPFFLGLNFFMTFIICFEDNPDPRARLHFLAHKSQWKPEGAGRGANGRTLASVRPPVRALPGPVNGNKEGPQWAAMGFSCKSSRHAVL